MCKTTLHHHVSPFISQSKWRVGVGACEIREGVLSLLVKFLSASFAFLANPGFRGAEAHLLAQELVLLETLCDGDVR